jgi:hypothetical protein
VNKFSPCFSFEVSRKHKPSVYCLGLQPINKSTPGLYLPFTIDSEFLFDVGAKRNPTVSTTMTAMVNIARKNNLAGIITVLVGSTH